MSEPDWIVLSVFIFACSMVFLCIGVLCAHIDAHQLDLDEWQCSESILVGEEHSKRSECIQYGRVK